MSRSTKTARCSHCGASVLLERLVDSALCPFCRQPHEIDPQWLEGALAHEVRADRVVAEVDSLHTQRAQQTVGNWFFGTIIIGFFGCFGLIFLEIFFSVGIITRIPNDGMLGLGVGIAIFFIAGMGLIGLVRRAGAVPKQTISCPSCGAESEKSSGSALGQCLHCGSSLLPGTATLLEAASMLEWERRRATSALNREIDSGSQAVIWLRRAIPSVRYWIGSLFFFNVLVFVLDFPPDAASWVPFIGSAAVVLFRITAFLWRVARFRSSLEGFGLHHGGELLDTDQLQKWKRRYWLAEDKCDQFVSLAMHVGKFPVLIWFGECDGDGDHWVGRVQLATWNPEGVKPEQLLQAPHVQELVEDVRARGFDLTWTPSGLEATVPQPRRNKARVRELAGVLPILEVIARRSCVPPAPDLDGPPVPRPGPEQNVECI